MHKGRLEAFSDGVIAIIITIMVLELKPPHEATWFALRPLVPLFVSYLLSFIYIAIYWNNHHHLLQASDRVDGIVLWANMHLLFWLSLIPFITGWIGTTNFAMIPIVLYGVVLLFTGIAYHLLTNALLNRHGRDSTLAEALGNDYKSRISVGLYSVAILLAFLNPLFAFITYVVVALMWFVPDRRIERKIS